MDKAPNTTRQMMKLSYVGVRPKAFVSPCFATSSVFRQPLGEVETLWRSPRAMKPWGVLMCIPYRGHLSRALAGPECVTNGHPRAPKMRQTTGQHTHPCSGCKGTACRGSDRALRWPMSTLYIIGGRRRGVDSIASECDDRAMGITSFGTGVVRRGSAPKVRVPSPQRSL
jgi:hypothetical protein